MCVRLCASEPLVADSLSFFECLENNVTGTACDACVGLPVCGRIAT